jgi:VanZ family protein
MLASYIIPIAFVYYKYNAQAQAQDTGTRSISSIITSTEPFLSFIPRSSLSATAALSPLPTYVFQTRHFIALCMLTMAGFTVLYEYQRQRWSLITIIVLLCGIFGVIFIPEQNHTHYIFAAAAFFAIVGFMIGHTFCATSIDIHDNLRLLLYAQIMFMVITVIGVIQDTAIFAIEALFLLNFAVFYVYLHFSTTVKM